jgi:hypothetical protein
MTRTWYDRLTRLGRWPRRVAALLCLALAAASALSGRHGPVHPSHSPARHPGIAAELAPGRLAVPVVLSDDAASSYIRSGDRIDLYASADDGAGVSRPATLVAAGLPVISVLTPKYDSPGAGGTRVIVSAEPLIAARIAGTNSQSILAVVDKYP